MIWKSNKTIRSRSVKLNITKNYLTFQTQRPIASHNNKVSSQSIEHNMPYLDLGFDHIDQLCQEKRSIKSSFHNINIVLHSVS